MSEETLIAIWAKSHDPLDFFIKFFTHGRGTHAAFVRRNGKIAENFLPHVHERDWKFGESDNVELYRIDRITKEEVDKLELWIDAELKMPAKYSIFDLFRYALNLPPAHGKRCFCSQWVLRGCRINLKPENQPLVRLEHEDFASPRDLRISPKLILIK